MGCAMGRSPGRSPKRAKVEAVKVGFQGADHAFSEIAARKSMGSGGNKVDCVGYETFAALFEAVKTGEVNTGIVPLENSVSGTVNQIYGLLLQYADCLHITAEAAEVEHPCLCALPGAKLANITKVFSDAYHISQCSHFLDGLKSKPERCVTWDSAGSCQMLEGSLTSAAISTSQAAEAAGLQILKKDVSNMGGLATRYVTISKKAATIPRGPHKCTAAVHLSNEPLALMKLVSAFALRNINISKLESQPACLSKDMFSGRHFDYLFFIDFEPSSKSESDCVVANLQEFTQKVTMLGSYKKNVSLEDTSMTEMPWTAYI